MSFIFLLRSCFILIAIQICDSNRYTSRCPKLIQMRLSGNVVPDHYDITIHFDLSTLFFNGNVNVSVRIENETNEITLHGKDLFISSAKFIGNSGEIKGQVMYCKGEETVTFYFHKSIKSNGSLYIEYAGNLPWKKIHGIYALKQLNGNETRHSIVGQFESSGARTAFPCFDEPNMKATFSFSIIAPKDRTVLSNMHIIENVSVSDTETKVIFAKSPKMSTYTTCIVIGDFDFIEQNSTDGKIRIRVYTQIGLKSHGFYALRLAVRVLDFLQKYLNMEYTLKKLDLVSVFDFDSLAMENWGVIIFAEKALLISDENHIVQRQDIATAVTHEISHQWFGNLVTPKWWTHTWISEGITNFFHNFMLDKLFDEWDYWYLYLSNDFSKAMDIDSLQSTHAVMIKHLDVADIDDIAFDTIIYSKGGELIRIIKEWIGEESFRKSLQNYLSKYKYGSVETKHLFQVFEEVSGKPVNNIMSGWVSQKGYPLLKILKSTSNSSISLEQKKFILDTSNDSEKNVTWTIPVFYTNSGSQEIALFNGSMMALNKANVTDWNYGSIGFYRTQYESSDYQRLFNEIKNGNINQKQRFSLQNDFFALSKSGRMSIIDYLNYLKNYKNEDKLFIWKSISNSLSEISDMLSAKNCSSTLKNFTIDLMSTIWKKLSKSNASDDFTTLLRVLIYRKLGLLGDTNIAKDAWNRIDKYYNRSQKIDLNYRSAVFDIVFSNASDEVYDTLFKLFKRSTDDAYQRVELANAMGSSSIAGQLQRALNFSLSSEVTISDSVVIAKAVASSKDGRQLAWNFFINNFDVIKEGIRDSPLASSFIKGIVTPFNSFEKADEIEKFFRQNKFEGIESGLQMSLEIVRNKAKWIERDASNLCNYLNHK